MTKTQLAIGAALTIGAFLVAWNMQWLPFSYWTYKSGLPIPWLSVKIAFGIVLGAWALRLSDYVERHRNELLQSVISIVRPVRPQASENHLTTGPDLVVATGSEPRPEQPYIEPTPMRGSSLVAPIMLFVLASAMAGIIQMAGRQAEYQPELPAQTSSGLDLSPQTSPHQTPPSSGPYDPREHPIYSRGLRISNRK